MKLVVGLGNPGDRYNFTRHNSGFLALDFYFKVHKLNWENSPRFGAIWGRNGDILFIKPQGFYNESGRVVAEFMRFYKIKLTDIVVICDNFDLKFGKIRYRSFGRPTGNNGLRSINSALKTSAYPRIRIGTKNDELRQKMGNVDFVLSKFTPEEKAHLPEILRSVCAKIDEIF